MDIVELQKQNYIRLQSVVNTQIDINNCIQEGDVYDSSIIHPILVDLGLLGYEQYKILVWALDNQVYFT